MAGGSGVSECQEISRQLNRVNRFDCCHCQSATFPERTPQPIRNLGLYQLSEMLAVASIFYVAVPVTIPHDQFLALLRNAQGSRWCRAIPRQRPSVAIGCFNRLQALHHHEASHFCNVFGSVRCHLPRSPMHNHCPIARWVFALIVKYAPCVTCSLVLMCPRIPPKLFGSSDHIPKSSLGNGSGYNTLRRDQSYEKPSRS